MMRWIRSHKILAYLIALAIVMLSALLFVVETTQAPAPNGGFNKVDPDPEVATITGEIVCLPHKDTSGPQTLECAFGIKLDDGTYYGLRDSEDNQEVISRLPTGEKVKLTGTLKEEPSDNYKSTGTFTVTSSKPLN